MSHRVLLPAREEQLLVDLIGRTLHAVSSDGWAAQLRVGDAVLRVTPIEVEVSTPNSTSPRLDVERPSFAPVESASGSEHMQALASCMGSVTEVSKLRVALIFMPPVEAGPTKLPGLDVEIPAGIDYEAVFAHTSDLSDEGWNSDEVVIMDVGVEIRTDLERRVTLFTHGIGYFTFVAVDEDPDADWKGAEELVAVGRDL